MSDSETIGRCRQQLEAWYANNPSSVPRYSRMIADAIDGIAAELGDVKEVVREIALQSPSEFGRDASDVAVRAAKIERDAARADVERLKAELAARPPATGWLTEGDCWQLRVAVEHLKRLGSDACVKTIESILARAGSPPVVEVPAMQAGGIYEIVHFRYRAALDKAGVAWKEEPRE